MADASTRLQVNFKTPAGALLNLYAVNKEELATQLDDLAELIPRILELEKLASAVGTVQQTFAQPAAAPQAAQNVNTQTPGPAWAGSPQNAAPAGGEPFAKTCIHGKMTWRTAADGSWKGHFCPLPKNSTNPDGSKANCRTEYIR